jgi:hypothetical protein
MEFNEDRELFVKSFTFGEQEFCIRAMAINAI